MLNLPLKTACEALGILRATVYRHLTPKNKTKPSCPRDRHPRHIPDPERAEVTFCMHHVSSINRHDRSMPSFWTKERIWFRYARCTVSWPNKAKRGNVEINDDRATMPFPRLAATQPNEVWTWDISKLPTCTPGVFLNLYLLLDLYSRYPIAWMVAEKENSALAKQLVSQAYCRYRIQPGEVTLHNDRGAPMTAIGCTELLAELKPWGE